MGLSIEGGEPRRTSAFQSSVAPREGLSAGDFQDVVGFGVVQVEPMLTALALNVWLNRVVQVEPALSAQPRFQRSLGWHRLNMA